MSRVHAVKMSRHSSTSSMSKAFSTINDGDCEQGQKGKHQEQEGDDNSGHTSLSSKAQADAMMHGAGMS